MVSIDVTLELVKFFNVFVVFVVAVISANLSDFYVDKLLSYIAEKVDASRHIEFYLTWSQSLLMSHGPRLKTRAKRIMPVVRNMQKGLTKRFTDLSKL